MLQKREREITKDIKTNLLFKNLKIKIKDLAFSLK